jgi:PAS domain S-box-containing protein
MNMNALLPLFEIEKIDLLHQVLHEQLDELELLSPGYGRTLLDSEPSLSEVFEHLPVLLMMVDASGVICQLEGRAISGVIGVEQFTAAVGQSLDRVFRHMPAIPYDMRSALVGKTVNNTIKLGDVAFRACYQPLHSDDGIVGAVAVLTDIHNLPQPAPSLTDSEIRLKAVFEQTQQFLCLLRLKGQVIEVNREALEFAGLKEQEVLGKPLWEIAWWQSDDSAVQLQRAFQQCVDGEVVRYETQMRGKDNTTTIDLTLKPVQNSQKQVIMILAEGFNITERKIAEEQIRLSLKKEQELSDLKSRFITFTSHEFRTPLAIIASSAYLLRRGAEKISTEQRDRHFDKIQHNVDRIAEMLDDILLLGRLQAQQAGYEPEEYPVSQIAELLVKEFAKRYQHTHTFTFQSSPADIRIRADQTLLEQAFTQLLKNAVVYSSEPGAVEVYLSFHDNTFMMSVSDNGIGILPQDLPHIFDSFVRGSNVDNLQGNGLGLAIVKDVVELHHGTVIAQSQPGATTFTITIPQHQPS